MDNPGVSLEFEVAGQWNRVVGHWAAKPRTQALAPAHARGVGGMLPRKIFKNLYQIVQLGAF